MRQALPEHQHIACKAEEDHNEPGEGLNYTTTMEPLPKGMRKRKRSPAMDPILQEFLKQGKLTPIKGRGHGPRKKGFKRPDPKSVKVPATRTPRPKQRAMLEQLPTEILQKILLLSRELNFPRASLLIGYRLSPRSFLSEMVLQAFAPTWDEWFGCLRRNVVSYYGWFEDRDRFPGEANFQSDILAARWFKLDYLHQAMNVWNHRHGKGRFYEHSLSDSVAPNLGQFKQHGLEDVNHCKDARECFKQELDWYRVPPMMNRPDINRLEAHPDIRIPDNLLMGPWTKHTMSVLFWLRMNNAKVKDDQNWELTKPGLNCVLDLKPSDGRLVIDCLLDIGAFENFILFGIDPIDEAVFWDKDKKDMPLHRDPDSRRVMRKLCQAVNHNFDGQWLGRWAGCVVCTGGQGRRLSDMSTLEVVDEAPMDESP